MNNNYFVNRPFASLFLPPEELELLELELDDEDEPPFLYVLLACLIAVLKLTLFLEA